MLLPRKALLLLQVEIRYKSFPLVIVSGSDLVTMETFPLYLLLNETHNFSASFQTTSPRVFMILFGKSLGFERAKGDSLKPLQGNHKILTQRIVILYIIVFRSYYHGIIIAKLMLSVRVFAKIPYPDVFTSLLLCVFWTIKESSFERWNYPGSTDSPNAVSSFFYSSSPDSKYIYIYIYIWVL